MIEGYKEEGEEGALFAFDTLVRGIKIVEPQLSISGIDING